MRDGLSFRLVEEVAIPPLHKRYSFDPADPDERRLWDFTAITEDEEGAVAGFRRRASTWRGTDASFSGTSMSRPPVGVRASVRVCSLPSRRFARSTEARCIWLETQNVNVPAIRFYQRIGFQFCGFDATLYDPAHTPKTEIALFFTHPVFPLHHVVGVDQGRTIPRRNTGF